MYDRFSGRLIVVSNVNVLIKKSKRGTGYEIRDTGYGISEIHDVKFRDCAFYRVSRIAYPVSLAISELIYFSLFLFNTQSKSSI